MLRLYLSAPARAIGSTTRTLAGQRRHLSAVKIPKPEARKASISDPKPPVFPGGASPAAPPPPPAIKPASPLSPPSKTASPATPTNTNPTQVPLTPPSPTNTQTSIPTPTKAGGSPSPPTGPTFTSTPPSPPPPAAKTFKKTHRFRRFLIGFTLLTGAAFGGGVYYSLKSDNFHDFFTEYIPFGEDAVLYFEEREFRRRFPNALRRVAPAIESPKVVIPKSSGATWRLADQEESVSTTDVGRPGPHISGRKDIDHKPEKAVEASKEKPVAPTVIDGTPIPPTKGTVQVESVAKPGKPTAEKIKEVDLSGISDPVVKDLAKVVNSIIILVNEKGSSDSFGVVIDTAKHELAKLNDQIGAIKNSLEKTTEEKLKEKDLEFATAAQGLLKKVNDEVGDMEHRWRDEFDRERDYLANSYREKLRTELERSGRVYEERLRNELLEQAIEMKRAWISQIEDRVENERNGRLGKLKELSEEVKGLEKLSTEWAKIIDFNLRTQRLHVALEAVRNAFESSEQPKPFLRELAALKEVADDDDVINAAIDSINPRAYQSGVFSPSQLIERFRSVSEEVRKAALVPEDAGVAGHATSLVLSKLLFKKKGLAQGTDVESILTKAETYLTEGDLDNAAREVNQLQGWAKTLARDWLKEARLVLEVQQALNVIAAEARLQSLRVQEE
ncbi:MICOS complex subunit mic60 [Rhizina undulata]